MITAFAPQFSRVGLLRLFVFFLRLTSLSAAVVYAVVAR
jgi:hypothetical protein